MRERKVIKDPDPLFSGVETSALEELLANAERLVEDFSAFKRRIRTERDRRRQKNTG